jgi:hypothetical protein
MTASDSPVPNLAVSPRPRLAAALLLVVFGAVLGGLVVFYGLKLVAHMPFGVAPAPATNTETAALARRLAAAEARIAALEKTPAVNVAVLESRLTRLEQAPAAPQDARLAAAESALAELRQRVGALETKDASDILRRAAALLALGDLIRAGDSGAPFTRELASLRSVLPESEAAQDLTRYAATGVPGEALLAAQFPDAAGAAIAAERKAHAQSWLGRIWANIADLVVIRRIGEAKGNDTQSRLARAELRLKAHDLAAAIAELSALHGPARGAVQPWLRDAEARLAFDRDTAALGDALVHELSAPQHGPAP